MSNELTPAAPASAFAAAFDAVSGSGPGSGPDSGSGSGPDSGSGSGPDSAYLATAELDARFYLDRVMAMVGVDGLVEALARPFLLAKVDQHAAAVRESLAAAGKAIDSISLAGYARSVIAVHQRHGRTLPTPQSVDWSEADWTVLRLVAVCHLADATDAF